MASNLAKTYEKYVSEVEAHHACNWAAVKFINVRHAAAIGLFTVWYLLTPPFVPGDPPGLLQLNAPLSQWSQMDSSDTSSGCEEQRDNMVRMYRSGDMTSIATQFKLWLYHNALCASSIDPRLRRLTEP